ERVIIGSRRRLRIAGSHDIGPPEYGTTTWVRPGLDRVDGGAQRQERRFQALGRGAGIVRGSRVALVFDRRVEDHPNDVAPRGSGRSTHADLIGLGPGSVGPKLALGRDGLKNGILTGRGGRRRPESPRTTTLEELNPRFEVRCLGND